ncbi:alpha/beta hydrolase [Aliikangiella maris]|uniref:Alpha/beta hydrolase-fold protein n=2 Tax=Aliikangiella maris TaxID=3162458 RepID=A0ABV3MN04_9GAMM
MFRLLIVLISAFYLSVGFAATPLNYGSEYQHHSKVMQQQRRYMVSLPERYQISQLKYPTLYVIDGDFQFHHVANTARHLARMGKIPPVIVVGVANQGPQDYLKSNTWSIEESPEYGGIKQFSNYIRQELIPLIDRQYRTNQSRALAGYSLGGLFVNYEYLTPDTPFDRFIAMSPSLWFDDYRLIEDYATHFKSAESKVYAPIFLSVASEKGMGVKKLVEVFKQDAPEKLQWTFKEYPDESHFSTALPALYDGFQFLWPNFFIDVESMMAHEDYLKVFELLAEKKAGWGGAPITWLQSYTFSKYVFYSKQQDKIPQIIESAKKQFPESANLILLDLVLGHNRKQQFQQAEVLLNSVAGENRNNAKWHYLMSVAQKGLEKPQKMQKYHQKALSLAKKQQLESWEYWEMEPYLSQSITKTKAN